jgi:hypothetical protein
MICCMGTGGDSVLEWCRAIDFVERQTKTLIGGFELNVGLVQTGQRCLATLATDSLVMTSQFNALMAFLHFPSSASII